MGTRATTIPLICYVMVKLVLMASQAEAGIRCDCSINGVTYSLVGINCARLNESENVDKPVQCEKARYGAVEQGYVVKPVKGKTGHYHSLYRLYRTSRNWVDASESCQRDGGHLAAPDNQEELKYLEGLLRKQGDGRTTAALLGVRKAADTDPYLSVTGKQLKSLLSVNWAAGEAFSVARQLCVELRSPGPILSSRDCGQPAGYFCERPLSPPVPADYRFIAGLGFYKPSADFLTYALAEQQCQKTGGHVVVVDTQQEADALMKAFDMYPQVEQIYVGIDDRRQAGVFDTLHSGRLEWLDFQNWAPGALESRSADVHCLVFTAAGSYQLVHCDTPLPTICEWPLG